jgi:hypothetical protein
METASYLKLLTTLMKDNPPTVADAPMVAQMAKIGLLPGKDWDISMLDPTVAKGLAQAPKGTLAKIMAHAPNAGKNVNGWVITMPAGVYGINYLQTWLECSCDSTGCTCRTWRQSLVRPPGSAEAGADVHQELIGGADLD